MRLTVLVMSGLLAVSAVAHAQTSPVVAGGPHDFSNGSAVHNNNSTVDGQTCVFCHTPHGGSNSIALWNRNAPSSTYQLYTSSTTDVTTTSSQLANSGSGACLSCHDGTIAMDVLTNVNGATFAPGLTFARQSGTSKATYSSTGGGSGNVMSAGLPFLGTDLRNDHPVAIVYETARSAKPTEFVTQAISGSKITAGGASPLPLFGTSTANATVECASCHEPHNNTLGNFLRKANTGSAMCLSCHIK